MILKIYLLKLLEKHRGKENIVVANKNGGKEGCYAAHILKYKNLTDS